MAKAPEQADTKKRKIGWYWVEDLQTRVTKPLYWDGTVWSARSLAWTTNFQPAASSDAEVRKFAPEPTAETGHPDFGFEVKDYIEHVLDLPADVRQQMSLRGTETSARDNDKKSKSEEKKE